MAKLTAPVLIAGGELDARTPPTETKLLFRAARGPKELWIVPGASHRNLHSHAGGEYERRILRFLRQHLGR